jgi:CRISPR-associated endonuclease/helicase Cas3
MSAGVTSFCQDFSRLTGYSPMRWQQRLFDQFVNGEIPQELDLPTGLGKTSVIAVWLLALAEQAAKGEVKLPRRLIYVVDRRTVVDQATDIAERLREALKSSPGPGLETQIKAQLSKLCIRPGDEASPLAISTLRGERADNREWQTDPARPAIVIGTVDMIGSRLLFSGYGVSRRMRPFHAGLLGQDTLLVHDEAHLSKPFGELIRRIAEFQQAQRAPRPLRFMELSATSRRQGTGGAFTLTDDEKAEGLVGERLRAVKRMRFEGQAENEDAAVAKAVELALRYKDERKRVLVYVRRPQHARTISEKLAKATNDRRVAVLTGTIRGHERDQLVERALFKGFRSNPARLPPEATEYLVSTSAGEVGIDLDADHLVCDLSTLDSMIQRLGRVNRLGKGEAEIDVVEWPKDTCEDQGHLAAAKAALSSLPKRDGAYDACPDSLRALADQTAAFSAVPRTVPLTDILLDNWALTRVKDLPGRPLPDRWLHGAEAHEPDLYVAWREEVSEFSACMVRNRWQGLRIIKQLYDKHPILAQERLRGPMSDIKRELKELKESEPGETVQAILLPVRGDPIFSALADVLKRGDMLLSNATIVLPPSAGGLDARGMLAGKARYEPTRATPYDVADDLSTDVRDERHRLRVVLTRMDGQGWSARPIGGMIDVPKALTEQLAQRGNITSAARKVRDHLGLAEKALLVLDRDEDGEPIKALQLLSASRSAATAQDDPAASSRSQDLDEHLSWTGDEAEKIVVRVGLQATQPNVAEAVVIAARWHDRGKARPEWQRAIGNRNSAMPLAKSGKRGFDVSSCGRYRHEFGSLREATEDDVIRSHPERDLILHIIAAHHGWARPHFEPEHGDLAVSDEQNAEIAAETMRRYGRLQRRFGQWGLAWLESLMRAADYSATERLRENLAQPGRDTGDAA